MKKSARVLLNAKELVPLIIRLSIMLKFISAPIPVFSSLVLVYAMGETEDKFKSLGRYVGFLLPVLILWGFYAIMFVKARKMANWISKTNSVVSIKGDPNQWIVPALQLFGVSLFVSGIASAINGIVEFFSSTDLPSIHKDGIRSLAYAVTYLTGAWVLITYPKSLANWLKKWAD